MSVRVDNNQKGTAPVYCTRPNFNGGVKKQNNYYI